MSDKNTATLETRDGFKSKWGFILACIGSAVGMGNIWRFPIMVQKFGGMTFLIPYFLFVLLIGSTGIIMAFLLCSLSFYLGADAIQGMLDFIPPFVLAGFGVAANILPAMGFAMLGRLVLTKQLVPFYFLGFLLCSYANVPVLGVALIAIIIGIDKFDLLGLGGAQPQLSAEGDEDDDF